MKSDRKVSTKKTKNLQEDGLDPPQSVKQDKNLHHKTIAPIIQNIIPPILIQNKKQSVKNKFINNGKPVLAAYLLTLTLLFCMM